MAASNDGAQGLARSVTRAARPASADEPILSLLDEERAAAAAEQRSELFWRERVEQESMTLRGALRAAAESGASARVVLSGGSARHGVILSVGLDVVEMHVRGSQRVLFALDRLCSVRVPGTRLLASEAEPSTTTLRSCIEALAEDRADVRFVLEGGSEEQGTLVTCGADVVVLRTYESDLVYVPVSAVGEVVVIAR
jgi:hypothetical protein